MRVKRDKKSRLLLKEARKAAAKEQMRRRKEYLDYNVKLKDMTEGQINQMILNAFVRTVHINTNWKPTKIKGAKVVFANGLYFCGKPFEFVEVAVKVTGIKHRRIKDGEDRVKVFRIDDSLRPVSKGKRILK